MAQFRIYKCRKCGYKVQTEPQGFYALMSGQYYNFKCKKCKTIVSLTADEIAQMGYSPQCPACGNFNHLSTWNPIEGECPKCNGTMVRLKGPIIMAD